MVSFYDVDLPEPIQFMSWTVVVPSDKSFTCSFTSFTNGFKQNFEVKNTNELICKCCSLWLEELSVLVLCWWAFSYFIIQNRNTLTPSFEIIYSFCQKSHVNIKRAKLHSLVCWVTYPTCSRASCALVPYLSRFSRASCPTCPRVSHAWCTTCSFASHASCCMWSRALRASCSECSSASRVLCSWCSCASLTSYLAYSRASCAS